MLVVVVKVSNINAPTKYFIKIKRQCNPNPVVVAEWSNSPYFEFK